MSNNHKTLYVGVTSNLTQRVYEHKFGVVDGFTKKYRLEQLVFYAEYFDAESAIIREKQIKKWNRAWKLRLIREQNPLFVDLSSEIL